MEAPWLSASGIPADAWNGQLLLNDSSARMQDTLECFIDVRHGGGYVRHGRAGAERCIGNAANAAIDPGLARRTCADAVVLVRHREALELPPEDLAKECFARSRSRTVMSKYVGFITLPPDWVADVDSVGEPLWLRCVAR